ncbi:ATP-binding protein [Candidatus Woesearchaeota archaeon]|jgi:hypothetical protein|nr:ATP-binding protein [Candidatus Woesearchaeota archaeon]MBT3538250.1 ATP-binding protein [Candidatus Woesearchaeota archaeon]MBT4697704.1 ATP-binding protein [Candidatus Woesearchaeota archaeon]MBT4717416.1 ATP-binding protein [Candidatus Woesearchaeota archaeon]MBT7105919.1 ATP-binding protein [Candidatus Woesearchaeota archaeon]
MDATIGTDITLGKSECIFPLENLKKHFIALGSSGSGKTVMCKVLIEEAILNNIPAIIVDPQGDLASLTQMDLKEVKKVKDLNTINKLESIRNAKITIFTPTSSKGIPLSINPLKLPKTKLDHEELISIINQIASSICKLIGYKEDDNGKSAQALLYLALNHAYKKKKDLNTFNNLIKLLDNLPWSIKREAKSFIKIKDELTRKLKFLTIGEKELLFQFGVPLDIEMLLGKNNDEDTTQISIIYLNTLENPKDKEFFVSILATNMYQWMLSNPSKDLQALFFIDEVAPYIPAGSLKPITKPILKLIYKQARKYGVGCIASTQNPGDIDYTCFSQFGTWAIGRLTTKQDKQKIKDTLESVAGSEIKEITETLPKLKPGEFFIFSPDAYQEIKNVKVRRLYTKHITLTEEDVKKNTTDLQRSEYNIIQPISLREDTEDDLIEEIEEPEEEIVPEPKKKGKRQKKSEDFSFNILYFPIQVREDEINELSEKLQKRTLITRKPTEEIVAKNLNFEPVLRARIKVRERATLGLKKETLEYVVFFDGENGHLLKFDSRNNFKSFPGFSRLIKYNREKLETFKTLYERKEPYTHSYLASLVNLDSKKVKKHLKELQKDALALYNQQYEKWVAADNVVIPSTIGKISSPSIVFSREDMKGSIIESTVDEKNLKNVIELWFNNTENIEIDTVYYPIYELVYKSRNNKRFVKISAVNGKIL